MDIRTTIVFTQEIDGGGCTLQGLSWDARQFASLAADGHIEAFITLLAELLYGDVLADFHTSANLHTNLAHDVDFGLDDIFIQFIGRDAIAQHAARLFALLEHGRFVAHGGEVVGTAQSCGTATDDGNLFLPVFLNIRANIHFRHKAGFSFEVLLGNELLHRIDGNGLVDGATGAGILATTVAHATADGREGVLALDEFQGFGIFAFGSFLQIALHGDMGGTGGLARRRARWVAVDTVLVAIVLIPFVLAPFRCIGQFLLGIGLLAVFGAKLLSQPNGTSGAVFHAAATGHAVLRVDFSHVSTTRKIRCIKEL